MQDVILIGYGNVGQSLYKAIQATSGFRVTQIMVRTTAKVPGLPGTRVISDPKDLIKADLYLICVSDDAIREVSNSLPFDDRLVAHTSGAAPVSVLEKHRRTGVFYPLQSFSKSKEVVWKDVPLCLEANSVQDLNLLKQLAGSLSQRVYEINTEQRKKIHLAAVIVNNFVNHLYYLAENLCKDHDIPFEVLHPLIMETSGKILQLPPLEAQTGPARRNDQKTLNSHLLQVKGTSLEEIYTLLTSSIIATYGREKL